MITIGKMYRRVVDPLEVEVCQRALGTRMRQLFDTVVEQPAPSELLEILRRVDAVKSEKAG